ncbi:MAG: DUF5926 family protein [Actinomycetota bacterium]|nr:DUF5926 family protein [Actinomycetota bacterium]
MGKQSKMAKQVKQVAAGASNDERAGAHVDAASVPVVGLREPCPCGSGRRYKACHGKSSGATSTLRTFEGFAAECDLIAMRELVPAATAPLTLSDGSGRAVTIATVLPMAWPALVRSDGTIMLGLQVNTDNGDVSRDLGSALARALEAEPGNPVPPTREIANAPRLQELVDVSQQLSVSVHEGFDFWIDDEEMTTEVKESLERANSYAHPTTRLKSVAAAYWTQMGPKEHLRWVMPQGEEPLLNALSRLHAREETSLGADTRLVGMFRAQGLMAPVWDLPLGYGAEACEIPAAQFGERLAAALKETAPLTDGERRARAGLTTRQVTLR